MKTYCQKCLKATEYNSITPKFCSFCAAPFASLSAIAISASEVDEQIVNSSEKVIPRKSSNKLNIPVKSKPSWLNKSNNSEDEQSENDESENINRIIANISEIECEITDQPVQKITLKDMALAQPIKNKDKFNRPKVKIGSKKQILEDFKREASNPGKNSVNVGGEE